MKKQLGVTLMELMIAIAIVGIIAGIAYPSYVHHIVNTRRADGKATLLDLAARMERFFANNNTYATATIASGTATTDVMDSATSPGGWYTLSIASQGTNTFTINAAPTGTQASDDTECATFTLTQLGTKGITGTGEVDACWD